MNNLKELISLITPNKIKQISILTTIKNKDSKLMQLYEGIHYNKFSSDQEAIRDIYGNKDVGSKYSKLKNNLEGRLINILLATDLTNNKMNDRQKAFYKYFKSWAAANILIKLGKTNYGLRILERSLKHLERHEFTLLALEASRILRYYSFRLDGDLRKGDYFDLLTKKYLAQYNAEIVLSGFLEKIKTNYVKQKGTKEHLNRLIEESICEAKKIVPKEVNATILYRLKMLEITRNFNQNDYKAISQICFETVPFFEKNYPHYRTYIIIFLNQWIISCTQLKEYEKASELVHKAMGYLKVGEYNWFKLMEYRTQLAFYRKDYGLVYDTYLEVIKQPNLSSLPTPIQEEWKLYEAYAQFVYLAGKVDGTKPSTKKFKVQKFLNDIHIFSQDKKGMNIPILFIHIAYLMLYRRYHQIIDKAEGLEKYRQRYLSNHKHERSNLFLKLLLLLVKHHFDPRLVQEDAQALLSELSAIPLNVFTTDHEVEIIPYEHFWELLLEILNSNANK